MAKKIYHLPLKRVTEQLQTHKSSFNKLKKDVKFLEYQKLIGKALYTLEIKEYLAFFKIDRDLNYALKVVEYFNSKIFFQKLYEHLNLSMFISPEQDTKSFIYGSFTLLNDIDKELFKTLLQKLFLHYQTSVNNPSNIEINFKDITTTLLKNKNQQIRDSFGESQDGKVFFKLFVDDILEVNLSGKSIKTLRKKAYKELFERLF